MRKTGYLSAMRLMSSVDAAGFEPEVEPRLVGAGLVAAMAAAGSQVLRDDLRALRQAELLGLDRPGHPSADDRAAVSCSKVPHPLRLPGQGNQVVVSPVVGAQDGQPSGLAGGPAAHLQRHGIVGRQTERCQQHSEPVQPPVPVRGRPVRRTRGVVLRLHRRPFDEGGRGRWVGWDVADACTIGRLWARTAQTRRRTLQR